MSPFSRDCFGVSSLLSLSHHLIPYTSCIVVSQNDPPGHMSINRWQLALLSVLQNMAPSRFDAKPERSPHYTSGSRTQHLTTLAFLGFGVGGSWVLLYLFPPFGQARWDLRFGFSLPLFGFSRSWISGVVHHHHRHLHSIPPPLIW